jgi:ornithine carbamoyltransferase
MLKHFIDLDKLSSKTLRYLIDEAKSYKNNKDIKLLKGKTLAMLFEKPSTRTRVSFEVGMKQLGGNTVVLDANTMQLGRGETVADTAKALSRYVDAIMIRTGNPQIIDDFVSSGSVPIINALTDMSHPCQIMADIMTFEEHRGPIKDKTIVWVGDGNNVANSWIHASAHFGFELRIACPKLYYPDQKAIKWAVANGAKITLDTDAAKITNGADCVVTDAWVSMGFEKEEKHKLLQSYQVNSKLMKLANPNAIFMHCLPAHRGEEVTNEVIDGKQSVVWDEAENRLHTQKAILAWCLSN